MYIILGTATQQQKRFRNPQNLLSKPSDTEYKRKLQCWAKFYRNISLFLLWIDDFGTAMWVFLRLFCGSSCFISKFSIEILCFILKYPTNHRQSVPNANRKCQNQTENNIYSETTKKHNITKKLFIRKFHKEKNCKQWKETE